jgi:hypothetical protein
VEFSFIPRESTYPRYPLHRRSLGGSQSRSHAVAKRNKFLPCPCRESNPRLPDCSLFTILSEVPRLCPLCCFPRNESSGLKLRDRGRQYVNRSLSTHLLTGKVGISDGGNVSVRHLQDDQHRLRKLLTAFERRYMWSKILPVLN